MKDENKVLILCFIRLEQKRTLINRHLIPRIIPLGFINYKLIMLFYYQPVCR